MTVPDTAPAAPAAPPAPPPSTVRALSCPNCGGIVNVRAQGLTVSVLCEHCGSTLDATSPDLQVIALANEALKQPQIPLGTRGTLGGRVWEVVGYVERTDEEVVWAEYLLFNPYEGYAFLVDDGRRFSLGVVLDRLPAVHWSIALLDSKIHSRFGATYPVRTTFVVGEFYWRVAVGEMVDETDFVRPGTMLACEEYQTERTWTKLDMLDWGVAEQAFGILPRRRNYSWPAPHERSPYKRQFVEAVIIALVALFILQIISGTGSREEQIIRVTSQVVLDGPGRNVVIHGLTLPPGRSRVVIDANAGAIDNAWVDLDYTLTNQATQRSVRSYSTAEHYSGTDISGSWSHGDPRTQVALSSIPGGRYDVTILLAAHRWDRKSGSAVPTTDADRASFARRPRGTPGSVPNSAPQSAGDDVLPVSITIKRGGVFGGVIFLAFMMIAAWPVIVLFKHFGFEKRRKASAG